MTVLICGGRNVIDEAYVRKALDELKLSKDTLIIQGGARGVDNMARTWAIHNGYQCKTFPAKWGEYGKAAGAIRNQQMIDEGQPDKVIAFPGGRGTEDMKSRARIEGIEVVEIKPI